MVPYFKPVKILNKKITTFEFWGTVGFILSGICSLILSKVLELNVTYTFILILLSIGTFYLLNLLTFKLTHKVDLVFYHLAIVILIIHYSFLKLLNLPIYPYLDITVLGIAVNLVLGRIGCFLSGCCHGKPNAKGVKYQISHLTTGFSRKYYGLKVLPVQLIEASLVLTGIALFTTIRLYSGIPGTIFQPMLMWYFLLRFCLEFFRGDTARGYFLAVTYCQWLSLIFGTLLLLLSQPFTLWIYFFVLGGWIFLCVGVLFIVAFYFLTKKDLEKFYPEHLMELSETFRHNKGDILYITSKGLGFSFKVIQLENNRRIILTFSNFHSSAFSKLLSDSLAGFLYQQLGEKFQRFQKAKNIFQYINK